MSKMSSVVVSRDALFVEKNEKIKTSHLKTAGLEGIPPQQH
jgi:hypothetical protein